MNSKKRNISYLIKKRKKNKDFKDFDVIKEINDNNINNKLWEEDFNNKL